jgi:putative flavoprotein involved in K+ transport
LDSADLGKPDSQLEGTLMATEKIDTLVIGGGQAGIAMSEHLSAHKIPHLVLERSRIAESWRTARWDSLVANGPAWHDRFPNMKIANVDDDAFATKHDMVSYFEAYARQIAAPMRCGVEVKALHKTDDGFRAETTDGVIEAENVVVATGPFQRPLIPAIVPQDAGISQIHSYAYKNPNQLPAGAVLVVGAGSSGVQIADELQRSGRKVYLSVGPHNKPPRRYRGKDFCWWLGKLGHWDMKTPHPGMEHVTIAVSGARGGHTVDFRRLAQDGMTLVGMAKGSANGVMQFAPDIRKNIERGDADYLSVLDTADAYAKQQGLVLPEDSEARIKTADPECLINPVLELDFKSSGVSSIVWATGYALDFNWIKLDMFNDKGRPHHDRGVSTVPGLYFLGLPWLSRRASAFIWGVWTDAEFLAGQIAKR